MRDRKFVSGIITLTQEHRFQLVDGNGRKIIFILSHESPVQGRDLERMEKSRAPVKVTYEDAAMLNALIAYDLFEQ